MADPETNDPLEELVSLNFKITERQRREFKVWCAERGITQVDGFRRGFKLLKDTEKRN
ncbi:hypothetical protein BCF46_3836 [Litoreibacter meonggei]|uniref:Uncharacterized protein n=1 Tax=Litoreibacter meonggei TaxID=1049199 RepID=A0A497VBD3_9RHOB|nr:hypothetical protein BCF46_3836 [Litoreibacter meonggei]